MFSLIEQNSQESDKILEIFKELEKKANEINPDLIGQITSFNDNHVVVQSYESYLATLNEVPSPTATNSVDF
jgi:hypothetical protein